MFGKHYVYLLVNTDRQIFKVGETEGIHTRVKELCKHLNYDIKNSYVFTFSSYMEAIELEKQVHKNFKNFNVPKKDLPKFAGYTELYYDVILQDVIHFIFKSSFSCEFELLQNYYRKGLVPFKDIIE